MLGQLDEKCHITWKIFYYCFLWEPNYIFKIPMRELVAESFGDFKMLMYHHYADIFAQFVYKSYLTVTLHIKCVKELNKYCVDTLDFTSHFCTVSFFLTPSFFSPAWTFTKSCTFLKHKDLCLCIGLCLNYFLILVKFPAVEDSLEFETYLSLN